ncbi:MAG: pyrroloquinoline quinone biosynthesis peptide chaperone PqqD [Kiloniellales bacterium]|nr:pyrroloquinoline quinone biosynthesis peptide chaperone PqqD [Kiloniellales bacterium]
MNDAGSSSKISLEVRPRLAGFVRLQFDKARENWIIQAPERVLVLDESAREVVERCTGEATVGEMVDGIVAEFDAPRDIIVHDVIAVLSLLLEKGFLELQE